MIVLVLVAFFISMGVQVDRVVEEAHSVVRSRAPASLAQPQYAPEIQSEIDKAHATQRAIDQAIAEADHPFEEIQEDVKMIVSAMETSAKRAQMIHDTLHDQSQAGHDERAIVAQIEKLKPRFGDKEVRELVNDLEAQREAHVKLRESLERFSMNMARLNASLGLLRTLPDRDVGRRGGHAATRAGRAGARDPRPHGALHARAAGDLRRGALARNELQRELDRDAAAKGGTGANPAAQPRDPAPGAGTSVTANRRRSRRPSARGADAVPARSPSQRAPSCRPSRRRHATCRCATARSRPRQNRSRLRPTRAHVRSRWPTARSRGLSSGDADPQNPPRIDTKKER